LKGCHHNRIFPPAPALSRCLAVTPLEASGAVCRGRVRDCCGGV
jgi:hypothetical protein